MFYNINPRFCGFFCVKVHFFYTKILLIIELWLLLHRVSPLNLFYMTKKVKTVIELLEADGWEHKRTKGDHRIFCKAGERRPVVVSGHLNDDMPEGTWNSIRKQAKLKD